MLLRGEIIIFGTHIQKAFYTTILPTPPFFFYFWVHIQQDIECISLAIKIVWCIDELGMKGPRGKVDGQDRKANKSSVIACIYT